MTALNENTVPQQSSQAWWTCEHCGLQLSFKEVCSSGGHDCGEGAC